MLKEFKIFSDFLEPKNSLKNNNGIEVEISKKNHDWTMEG